MGRNRHDSAGAVVHQDEVCKVDRHTGFGQRIDAVRASENTLFFKIIGRANGTFGFSYFFDKRLNLTALPGRCKAGGQGVLGGQ